MIYPRGANSSNHYSGNPRHHRLPLHTGILGLGTGRREDIEPGGATEGIDAVEGGGMNVPDAGERDDADGFGGNHRIPGIGIGPDGEFGEAVAGIDEGSGGPMNVYDLCGERGADEDASHGLLGRREQSFGDRDRTRLGFRICGWIELSFPDAGVEGGRPGDSAVEHGREREPAGTGTVQRFVFHGVGFGEDDERVGVRDGVLRHRLHRDGSDERDGGVHGVAVHVRVQQAGGFDRKEGTGGERQQPGGVLGHGDGVRCRVLRERERREIEGPERVREQRDVL